MKRTHWYPTDFSDIIKFLIAIILAYVGVRMRLYLSGLGENHDGFMWRDCAHLFHTDGEVAMYTGGPNAGLCNGYNYGPIWYNVLALLSYIPYPLQTVQAGFLALCDLGISGMLWLMVGWVPAFLYWFNPISLIISGYHRQFDCFALLLGMIAIWRLSHHRSKGSLVLLGISLSIKHSLLFFPIWLALKPGKLWWRLTCLTVPYLVFGAFFIPFLVAGAGPDIWHNVVQFRGFANAPFWGNYVPGHLLDLAPPFTLFISTMILCGIWQRRTPIVDSYWVYLICLVLFSSAIANEYLVIPLAALVVRLDRWAVLYMSVTSVYLSAQFDGLGLNILQRYFWTGQQDGPGVAVWHHLMLLFLLLHLVTYRRKAGTNDLSFNLTRDLPRPPGLETATGP